MTSHEPPAGTRGTKMEMPDAIVAASFAAPDIPLMHVRNVIFNLYRAGYMVARPDPRAVPSE